MTHPAACHYDRDQKTRLTGDGDPCEHDHCVICGRTHTTPAQPLTCPECIATVRTDLDDIRWNARHLRWHASRGDGLAIPAARIPGGDAMVVLARAGQGWDDLRVAAGYTTDTLTEDHHPDDVVPVLLPLLGWEHQWRTHFAHTPRATRRAPVTAITHYLADHLHVMAQCVDGPDWLAFAADMAALRRQLEGILHDEQDPQRGVPCFDCGERLVRRWGKPKPCRHDTPGRRHLADVRAAAAQARAWVATLRTYPELGEPSYAELRDARRTPTSAEESAARVPCTGCTNQGGIEDPSVGQSWECLGCRREYSPGEYANAVRAYLLTSGPDRDGWTHIQMAAEAATTQTGIAIPAGTVRRWMERGKVASVCRWAPGARAGLQLVFWPDVADAAAAAVARIAEREEQARVRQLQKELLERAVAAGQDVKAAADRLGVHPSRLARFRKEWAEVSVPGERLGA